MELKEVIPPPLSPAENSLELFLRAIALWNTNRTALDSNPPPLMRMVAPGKAMVAWAQPDVRKSGEDGATNSWDEMQTAVDQDRAAIGLLHELIAHPKLDFYIAYERGFADQTFFTNLHLIQLKKSALLLSSVAIVDLHNHRPDAAVQHVRTMLVLGDALRDQRTEISELVRLAIVSAAHSSTWEMLQSDQVTDAQLVSLQNDWERQEFVQSYEAAVTTERLVGDNMLKQWRSSNAELKKCVGVGNAVLEALGQGNPDPPTFFQEVKFSTQIFMWRYWWSYTDELRVLQGHEALVESARYANTNGAFVAAYERQQVRLGELGIAQLTGAMERLFQPGPPDLHSVLSASVVTLGNGFKKTYTAEAMKRLTVTAIALKRFQLKQGRYPAQLSGLEPEFLVRVPRDPADGNPLRYRLNSDGTFLLYSIGEDGKDDGGDEKSAEEKFQRWRSGRDLVWPQPATDDEVRAWRESKSGKSE